MTDRPDPMDAQAGAPKGAKDDLDERWGYSGGGGEGQPGSQPVYYALIYHMVDDYLERRPMYRDNHLELARAAYDRGELVLAGAWSDPADGALLVFRVRDRSTIEAFVRDDPYVVNGLVTWWEIRAWTVVIGGEPATAG